MAILFRRIRGRAAGHVIAINPLTVRSIEPTSWGGSEINFSDVHAITSRDSPAAVQQLLEGRTRLCSTPLCDHDTSGPYEPLCQRCREKPVAVTGSGSAIAARSRHYDATYSTTDLVIVGDGRHGFA
jgi:hypothetical protein